jgi:hypothetical protein
MLAVAVAVLAIVETVQAVLAPRGAPTSADWQAAARQVRAGFRPGDLIVAAPDWADPLLRLHLGDLMPIAVAARMDDARYGRVWEISQRGARALSHAAVDVDTDDADTAARPADRVFGGGHPDSPFVGKVTDSARWGALTVRRIERRPAQVTFDVLERWQEARVTRTDGAGASRACPWRVDRFVCPGGNGVHRELVEVDTRIRRALLAPPVSSATIGIEFPAVALGRELAIGAGLHDVWARKYATGTVHLETWIGGARASQIDVGNRSGWRLLRIDTAARAGQTVAVRFAISSARPELRQFAFAAEARR